MLFDGGSLNGATDERPIPQLDLDEIRSSRPEKEVFSCELCDIFKNTFFNRTTLVAASVRCEYWVSGGRRAA